MPDYRVTPRKVAQYRCWCGQPITVQIFDGWGNMGERYEYPEADRDAYGRYHCTEPSCRALLRMAWLGQRPVQ